MKKLRNIAKRVTVALLTVALLTNSLSVTAFAAETVDPETAAAIEEKLQESNSEIITDAAEPDAAASDEEAGLALFLLRDLCLGHVAIGGEKSIGRGTLKGISAGQNNKVVYMPYEATGILSSVDGIKQMFERR